MFNLFIQASRFNFLVLFLKNQPVYCTKTCNIEIAHLNRSRSVSSSTYENELFLFQLWYQLWHRSLVYHKHRYSGCKFCVFPYGCNWKSSHHYGISKNTFSSLSSQYAPLLFSLSWFYRRTFCAAKFHRP